LRGRSQSTEPASFDGFVVHAYAENGSKGPRIFLVGRLRSGETFAVVEERESPVFYMRKSDLGKAELHIRDVGGRVEECVLRAIDGGECAALSWPSTQACQRSARMLAELGVRTYEADIRFTDQLFMKRGIHGPLAISGSPRKGRRVGLVFVNPEIGPADWQPELSVLSLDIETDPRGERIYAIGLVLREPRSDEAKREVLFSGTLARTETITSFPDEKSLLEGFCDRIVRWDPDIVTGWNVIDFDFRVIAERIAFHKIPFRVGRSDRPAVFLPGEKGRSDTVILPGRQVLDAMRVVRASPERFSDYTLETVASGVLGRGKKLEPRERERKEDAVSRIYAEDPAALCRYCLEDARLVIDILEKTGLLKLTLARSVLVGVGLDRAWTSIPAFEHLYIEALHRRGFVAPTLGVDPFPELMAPGGAIIEPQAGLKDNVLVFDFKSLYPTIMRTFNIDPLSYVPAHAAEGMGGEEREGLIRAPNGAFFKRETAVIPELLARFFERREEAKKRGDATASHVYKIIMNSFYGVLGARGCRFASGHLSGAVTGFGHHFLRWCEGRLTQSGYRVLYGDTDSLFVLSGLPQGTAGEKLTRLGGEIRDRLNEELKAYVEETYGVTSYLELEFERVYFRFFLPPVRSGSSLEGGRVRGRAKGYAGLLVPVDEFRKALGTTDESKCIEIVGMEAVRRDWTDLARGFQIGLLNLLFCGAVAGEAGHAALRPFVRKIVRELYAGRLDGRLVYTKALRKPVSAYTRSTPPHVKAAMILEPRDQRGLIRYFWTNEGPQPAARLSAPLDYGHYLEKQLKPIAQSFTEVLGIDLTNLFGGEEQLGLF